MAQDAHAKAKLGETSYTRGFTLVEMLVVVAVIAILLGIMLPALSRARARTREAQRKAALYEIRKAIELYLNQYGVLPGLTGPGECATSGCNSAQPQPWISGLAPDFMSVIPADPLNGAEWRLRYRPTASGNYELDAPVEEDYGSAQNDGGDQNTCPSPAACRFETGNDLTVLGAGP